MWRDKGAQETLGLENKVQGLGTKQKKLILHAKKESMEFIQTLDTIYPLFF